MRRSTTVLSLALIVIALAACGDSTAKRGDATAADTADTAGDVAPDTTEPDAADSAPDTTPQIVPLPALQGSSPADGDQEVPVTDWIVLSFASEVSDAMLGHFAMTCGQNAPPVSVRAEGFGGGSVLVNPVGELPKLATCTLTWPSSATTQAHISFTVADEGDPAPLAYDRRDLSLITPVPDDSLLVTDPSTATGKRVTIPVPDRPEDVKTIFAAITEQPSKLDGFSPLAPIVVALPAAADAASIPMTEAASLDPLASVGLFDVNPTSPTFGQRRAFDLLVEEQADEDGTPSHVWIVYPTAPLEARGRYAFVVTRRALADAPGAPGTRPFAASAYMSEMLGKPHSPAGEALALIDQQKPTLYADDVALLLSISVRSDDGVPGDLLAIRAGLRAAAPPTYTITDVTAPDDASSPLAAIVTGTWESVSYRDGALLARDAQGKPKQNGTASIPFVLALPKQAADGPVPIIIYEHGNPGSAEVEVPNVAEYQGLAAAGFAVLGFTNIDNREVIKDSGDTSAVTNQVFLHLLQKHRFPDTICLLDNAEQLAFLRLVPELADLDVLPVGAADGKPELDVDAPLGYLGISHGSFQGTGLLPFAPEIKAAALVVGGGRWSASLVHEEDAGPAPQNVYDVVVGVFPHVTRAEFWAGISLSQMGVDSQDWLMNAHHLYRDKLDLETPARASVLAFEGVHDGFVPVYSTRGMAAAFGLPQLDPIPVDMPLLGHAQAPLAGNIDATTTGAIAQFVPSGVAGLAPSVGCEQQPEGHFCAQGATEAEAMRVAFFRSALTGVPTITRP